MRASIIPPAPTDTEGRQLHQALTSPEATATCDFASAYLPHLVAWLQARNPCAAADLCEEAAVETVYDILTHPGRFDPERGKDLLGFLRLSARRDLLNLLRREARHRHEPLDENSVELRPAAGNYGGEGRGVLHALCEREDEEERAEFLRELRASLAEGDRVVLDLMLAGVRETGVFAEAMGIPHLPPDTQKREVKRAKDRIGKKARRRRNGS